MSGVSGYSQLEFSVGWSVHYFGDKKWNQVQFPLI